MRVAVLGCGYVGLELGRQLAADHDVVGVRRSADGVDRIERAGFDAVQVDVTDPENQQWGVTLSDRVYECVYLTTYGSDESTRPPKRTYAFPERRLYRYHCEAAISDQSHRIHTQILIEFLAAILER